jgi:hypothetical protein
MANRDALSTGIVIRIDTKKANGHLAASFSWWPLGWIMTIGEVTVPGTVDVTAWTELDYDDRTAAPVEIPCRWALTAYAGDFRGPEDLPGDQFEAVRSM